MLKENEVIMLVLGIGVMFLIALNRTILIRIRFWQILYIAYCVLFCGWLFTVLEGFFYEQLLNTLEHISYFISAVLLIIWVWRSTGRITGEGL